MFDHVLITGASSGLGQALALQLAPIAKKITLSGRNADHLAELSEELPGKCAVIQADLTISNERERLLEQIRTDTPDLLINNAGAGLYGNIVSHTKEAQMALFKLNAEALLDLTIEEVHNLKSKNLKGMIVNISSAASFLPFPNSAVYAASKAFVTSLSLSLDEELRSFGIRVLTSCPGKIATSFGKRASLGKSWSKPSFLNMSPEKAAALVIKQIKKKKQLYIFDWKYRLLIGFSKLLPRRLVAGFLKKEIDERIS